ncbi:MAG: hypothetical protein PHX64_04980 [Candidatus Omnitrophica bacterium]|nr:hypothetical protein [Candidatus Omnitrophota bacterium]MDD5311086.1 hypothetical protein [Candidatus Omnitrophota bacterium]MDD5546521.1 hypothetical protein [Candidatus Omnitrophota bacterium]
MKKIMLAVLLGAVVVSFSAAPAEAKVKTQSITGKVTSAKSADPSRGLKPTIAVTDDNGERVLFEITPDTQFYGIDYKPVTLEAIKRGCHVNATGTAITENIGSATSIRILK